MATRIDISKPVRLINPEKGEENLVFKVTNYNEETQRCYISPINLSNWNNQITPEELVSINDIKNIDIE
jgi:hypothetical protein